MRAGVEGPLSTYIIRAIALDASSDAGNHNSTGVIAKLSSCMRRIETVCDGPVESHSSFFRPFLWRNSIIVCSPMH